MNELNKKIEKRFQAVSKSRTFKNIKRHFDLDKRSVIDIGCSSGEFLAHFGSGSVGVTIAQDEALYGRAQGLTIVAGNIENDTFVSLIDQTFDVIFANNIFEHLYSPHSFLISIKKLLKKDGVLILGVPCVPKITSLMRFKKFRGSLSRQHINFFTRDTLRLSVERAGWIIEDTRGFHMITPFFDWLLAWVYPHFYVAARVDETFKYDEKRKNELKGYDSLPGT